MFIYIKYIYKVSDKLSTHLKSLTAKIKRKK